MKPQLYIFIAMIWCIKPASAQYEFISPAPGSKFHNPECTLIIREGSLIDESTIRNPELFEVVGSESKNHVLDIKLADDGKTILLIPTQPFLVSEEVTVTIKKGIYKLSGEALNEYTFNFYTRPHRSIEAEQQFAAYRKKVLLEDFGVQEETGFDDPQDDGVKGAHEEVLPARSPLPQPASSRPVEMRVCSMDQKESARVPGPRRGRRTPALLHAPVAIAPRIACLCTAARIWCRQVNSVKLSFISMRTRKLNLKSTFFNLLGYVGGA